MAQDHITELTNQVNKTLSELQELKRENEDLKEQVKKLADENAKLKK